MTTPEQKTQLAICDWLSLQHPQLFEQVIKIDNEGKRTIGGHMLAKRMGLHKGASDLFIAYPTKKYFGLFIEIKHDGWKGPRNNAEKLRVESQLTFINKMKDKGYYGELVTGVNEGIDLISRYLKAA